MTARLIVRDSRPTQRGGPVCAMSEVDADFWRLRRERAQAKPPVDRYDFFTPMQPAPRSFIAWLRKKVM